MADTVTPVIFLHPRNTRIVAYLRKHQPSAHSDLASEMTDAARSFPGIRVYSPHSAVYGYELLHTMDGVIFCAAIGQSTLLLRLPADGRNLLPPTHVEPCPEVGDEWVWVRAFNADVPLAEWRALLKKVVQQSYVSASR